MSQSQRQHQILELIQHKGFVSIDELVEHFKVTPQTIRRDLNQLADADKIRRHHGGAGVESSTVNASYQSRKIMNLAAKERIAAELVKMIPDGAALFINIGTTTETIAKALLNHRDLKVVTNNIHVASILSAKEDFTVIIAAGEVRHRDGGIIGEATCDFISQFQMDYGIIGISGISLDGSLLDFDYREVKVAQAIIEHSRHVILAADHTKFGRSAMVKQANISQVSHLFTDEAPPAEIAEILDANNISTHVV
ncbi:DeoR/GlpR family transcriptional regulator [Marinobacterium arenosum]|uniref:DeoR/GlpR family transcriptional regulator n=1 Tax=Marinobacterium arenosum TaxID=2862496 RepID=UPI001C952D00|nr:DeoR/GlpR family transcriptional regulator [Marinobacterium arenosum]MBY4676727.1 DeoR/GlpR family transcriptional regulator [Marinobacterium arenosum]